LCWLKEYCGNCAQKSRIILSRVTLAITLAAATLKLMQSPSMIAVCGIGKGITGSPSIKTWSGGSVSAMIAMRMALWLARRILIRSISMESTTPTVHLTSGLATSSQ
jgi:hypothetical protein